MEYEVQLAPVDKAVATPQGFLEPLCNSCLSVDCTNPIEETTLSIVGKIQKNRLYVMHNVFRQVVDCKGYQGNVLPTLGN